MRVELIAKWMRSRHRLMVFLVVAVSFLEKNITVFLILVSLIDRYMLIMSTDAIVTSSLFILFSLSISFNFYACTMENCE